MRPMGCVARQYVPFGRWKTWEPPGEAWDVRYTESGAGGRTEGERGASRAPALGASFASNTLHPLPMQPLFFLSSCSGQRIVLVLPWMGVRFFFGENLAASLQKLRKVLLAHAPARTIQGGSAGVSQRGLTSERARRQRGKAHRQTQTGRRAALARASANRNAPEFWGYSAC